MSGTGTRAVAVARGWIGTPYRHQASARGAGADCLGLLRGVWRELYGAEPEPVPAYTQDWSEPEGAERLWQAARRHLRDCDPRSPVRPGEV
ncbi:MAG: peptidase, partial [Rhodobacteraceae bacterium]|nr:peptidase [Paracoccaceae bacterium]